MRTLGLRRIALAEEAALGEELGSALAAYSAGVNAAAEAAAALPVELQLLRTEFEPWRPGRHPDPDQAAGAGPVDQLGARADPRRHGPRPRAPSWRRALTPATPRAIRSRSSREPSGAAADSRSPRRSTSCGRRSGSRPRRRARTTGPSRRGARRPAAPCLPAIRTCPRACRGSPTSSGSRSADGPAAGPRSRAGSGSPSARTTTSPGRSPTRWPTSWTCSSSGCATSSTSFAASCFRSRSPRS